MVDLEKALEKGSINDPYVVKWQLNDPDDPYNWSNSQKWIITAQVCVLLSLFSEFTWFSVGTGYMDSIF